MDHLFYHWQTAGGAINPFHLLLALVPGKAKDEWFEDVRSLALWRTALEMEPVGASGCRPGLQARRFQVLKPAKPLTVWATSHRMPDFLVFQSP